MNGPDEWDGRELPGSPGERPRIPSPRAAAEDRGPLPDAPPVPVTEPDGLDGTEPPVAPIAPVILPAPAGAPPHRILKSLLGAWALAACSAEETAAVEAHLTDCASCADEALRLREAVGLLHPADSLDLDPLLRSRVLEGCLGRRPARIPVPEWATPYDAETAKLDALLRDMGAAEWRAPVRLRWFEGERPVERETTVAGVMGHLMAVDGLVATALGLTDPLGTAAPPGAPDPLIRTETFWRAADEKQSPLATHAPWRDQSSALIRQVSFAGTKVAELAVPYGDFRLPLRDSFLDRAFECWVHAGDIAEAVDYPYEPPAAAHLHQLVDLAARLLPSALADRRRAGLAAPPQRLVEAGAPGRTLHLEVEGNGGGHWYIPLDSPAALGTPEHTVAHIALDSAEFCQLAAGHISPEEAAAGQRGERDAIRDVLFATASLSRL
ncbi:putative zinc finger protein [Streptomyces sp. 2333.5]|uniref:zf-HC2 domain-containing protein n=1 Tax=unclassified Streptomyces TaxID=2593676 RepID=UPI000896B445|nr:MULTISPECIES: zf-HC2 domain-containing protein [unclassified Streptomyces]PJJ03877.1 putative zinc finger protein [Streptomyces sp. 2333.5]SEE34768.1 Putative zinc-finger [Streptomyces sp. 2314.4]SEE61300.1 Putative zinc-finger [Streptomyces sp. 2112.2]